MRRIYHLKLNDGEHHKVTRTVPLRRINFETRSDVKRKQMNSNNASSCGIKTHLIRSLKLIHRKSKSNRQITVDPLTPTKAITSQSEEVETKLKPIIESKLNHYIVPTLKLKHRDGTIFEYQPNSLFNVFVVKALSPSCCQLIIHEAENQSTISGWSKKRHSAFHTVDQPLSSITRVASKVRRILESELIPFMASCYGFLGDELRVVDIFCVKYECAPNGQTELAMHRDGCLLTFNILLSHPSEFDGGGTFIEAIDTNLKLSQGEALIHCGKLRHKGTQIHQGSRYLLVGFFNVLSDRVNSKFAHSSNPHWQTSSSSISDQWLMMKALNY